MSATRPNPRLPSWEALASTATVGTALVMLRSERIRTRLFRVEGVVNTVASLLDSVEIGNPLNPISCEKLYQSLQLAVETLGDAASELQGEIMVQPASDAEQRAMSREERP